MPARFRPAGRGRVCCQGEGGDAAGLQAGQGFSFVLGGQGDFLDLEGLGDQLEVDFLEGIDDGEDGFAGCFLGDDDGLEDHFGGDVQLGGGFQCA